MVFQGAVPLGYDVKHFRETGETQKVTEIKEKSKKKKQSFVKQLSKRIGKKTTKKSQTTVVIKEREPTNIFHEESKFFKKELNLTKQEMFFK